MKALHQLFDLEHAELSPSSETVEVKISCECFEVDGSSEHVEVDP